MMTQASVKKMGKEKQQGDVFLTDEQIAEEKRFMKGIPRINLGALFLPPIWGPAHGIWITILYYPIWLFADNTFYAAYSQQTPLSILFAVLVFVSLAAVTVAFSLLAQPYAARRAAQRGIEKETYLRRQRIWAVVNVIVACLMIALATYYNIVIRPGLGG